MSWGYPVPSFPESGMLSQTWEEAMPDIFEYTHTVKDEEIDALHRASNVAFVQWMIDAATAHSAAQGWPADAYLARGEGWVVRTHQIEYYKPAVAGDRVLVRTWVATLEAATSVRRYRILRADGGELLAAAETKWAFIDFRSGRPRRIPEAVARAFPVVEG
jgi:acyl-CoA thioester hydrolase